MTAFLQLLVLGMATGGFYTINALGLVIVFRSSGSRATRISAVLKASAVASGDRSCSTMVAAPDRANDRALAS